MFKSPSVAYCERKFKITSRHKLIEELKDAPLTPNELDFMLDIIAGASIKELSLKYNVCSSRISKKKRALFERLHKFDLLQAAE